MFPHTEIERTTPTERTENTLGPTFGAVAGFLFVAITVLGIAIAVLAYCKKNGTPTKDPVYDYIDTAVGTFPIQPIRYSLETATNKAYGTTYTAEYIVDSHY